MTLIKEIRINQNFDTNIEKFTPRISLFLKSYFICESYAKELQKLALFENNKMYLRKKLSALENKKVTKKKIEHLITHMDMTKLRGYNPRDNIDLRKLKSLIDDTNYSHEKLERLFSSVPLGEVPNRVKSVRILRNEVVHSIKKTALNDIESRYQELLSLMKEFIRLFTDQDYL